MATMATKLREGLSAAIGALNDKGGRGGAARLAARLKVSQAAISQWSAVPLKRALEVEAITGVARSILRPDHFGEFSRPKFGKAA